MCEGTWDVYYMPLNVILQVTTSSQQRRDDNVRHWARGGEVSDAHGKDEFLYTLYRR